MIKIIGRILHDWFTSPDNTRYEAGRALWFLSVLAAIGYTGWHLYLNAAFDVLEFGTAMAALIAAGGWGIGAKDKAAKEARS